MKWSLLVGNAWGTEIRLHFSMLLIIPYALITFQPRDLSSALLALALIAAIFLCVALHELGHTAAARFFGIHVNSIVLWPLGGFANLSHRPEKVLPDVVISAAGPLANLIIFALLLALTLVERMLATIPLFPQAALVLQDARLFSILAGLSAANLALAVFNLLPVYPLDGGQIARGLLKLALGERHADTIMLAFSVPMALALVVLGLVLKDILVILTGLLLILAAISLNPSLYNDLMTWGLYFADRGTFYQRRGNYDSALRAYNLAIERRPRQHSLYIARAVTYLHMSACPQARADVDRALALNANSATAWTLLGEILVLDNQQQAALDAFNHAIRIRPGFAVAYLDRGGLYQQQGQMAKALEDMNRAVTLGRGSVIVYVLRAILRYQMGDVEGARADGEKALRYAPRWMLAFPEIFLVNLQGQLSWAMDYYGQAIRRMPGAYQAYQGRADACRVNHREDWAIADYNSAIQLAPAQAELYLARGRCYQALGYPGPASADYRQAAILAKQSYLRRQAEDLLRKVDLSERGGPSGTAPETA